MNSSFPRKTITSLADIEEADIVYRIKPTDKFDKPEYCEFCIELQSDGLYHLIYSVWNRQLWGFATKGNWVREWKTLAGCKRYILKKFDEYFQGEIE